MRRWFALVIAVVLLIPSVASPTGTLTIPNVLANLSGTQPASLLDANWTQIANYINAREAASGLAGSRPTAGTAGRWYFATDTNGGTLYLDNGASWVQVAPALVTVLAEQLTGLALSNDATNPSTTVDIAVGAASSDDAAIANRVLISRTSAITKTTAAWAVGTGNGGLDTGSVAAATWYHVYLIERTDTGVVDALLSTSATAPVMPANYTKKRRLGAVLTEANKALNYFTQDGDYFRWATTTTNNSPGANPGTAASLTLCNTPLGISTHAILQIHLHASTASTTMHVSDPSAVDEQASVANPSVAPGSSLPWAGIAGGAPTDVGARVIERTNTASQVRVRVNASDANVHYEIFTLGWWDHRGRG